jgi:hypothetical protein
MTCFGKKWTKKRLLELQVLEDLLIEIGGLDNTTGAITKLQKLIKTARELRDFDKGQNFCSFLLERCSESLKTDGKYSAEVQWFGKHVATVYADSQKELEQLCKKFNNGLLDK